MRYLSSVIAHGANILLHSRVETPISNLSFVGDQFSLMSQAGNIRRILATDDILDEEELVEVLGSSLQQCNIDMDDLLSKMTDIVFTLPDDSNPQERSYQAMFALKDDDEEKCTEDEESAANSAFEAYSQCTGSDQFPQDFEDVFEDCKDLQDTFQSSVMASLMGEGQIDQALQECLQSILASSYGDFLRHIYNDFDIVLNCMTKLADDLPSCFLSAPLDSMSNENDGDFIIPLSFMKKMGCVYGLMAPVFEPLYCIYTYDELDDCLPKVNEDTSEDYCAVSDVLNGKDEFTGMDSSVIDENKLPDFCLRVFDEQGMPIQELQARLEYYNAHREYGWTVDNFQPSNTELYEKKLPPMDGGTVTYIRGEAKPLSGPKMNEEAEQENQQESASKKPMDPKLPVGSFYILNLCLVFLFVSLVTYGALRNRLRSNRNVYNAPTHQHAHVILAEFEEDAREAELELEREVLDHQVA